MLHALLPFALVLCPGPHQEPEVGSTASAPRWIWASADPAAAPRSWFGATLSLDAPASSALLRCSADNGFDLWIDGVRVATGDAWEQEVRRDVSEHLAEPGEHHLAVLARNEGGPAGFWLELEVETEAGAQRLVTGADWRALAAEPADWEATRRVDSGGLPADLGPLGVAPWGQPRGSVDGLPPRVPSGEELEVPEGFSAELVYTVPKSSQGSWVSLCAAPDGTLVASDQYGSLYRIRPSAFGEGERGTSVRRIPVEVGQAQGLCFAFGALYFVGGTGGAGSGLYRATDTDGYGELDAVERLQALEGGGEHGPHAVRLAPGGESLLVIAGNHTKLPPLAGSRVPERWAEDQLLERAPDARGHAAGILAPGGWLCEVSPDGSEWTLLSMGMRNAYDFDLDPSGEVLTYDSDMEWDVGLPWYRPSRVLHLVPGSDFGWRHGSGKFPDTYPDTWPATLDLGLGSPTGVLFAPASFPAGWRGRLLVADWAYGTVHAVALEERGATFAGTSEVFLRGKPLPVTDLETGADGAVYLTTGGRRTQSALYRVRWTGAEEDGLSAELPPRAPSPEGELRRMLEDPASPLREDVDALMGGLRSDDAWIRRAARAALEELPVERWRAAVSGERSPDARLQGLVALARCGDRGDRPALVQAACDLPFEELDALRRVEALRLLALTITRLGPLLERERDLVLRRLDGHYPTGDAAVDRELLALLVALGAQGVPGRALEAASTAATQEEAIAVLFALRLCEGGWTPADRVRYFQLLREGIESYRGGASLRAYLEKARDRALLTVPVEELDLVAALLEPDARERLGTPVPARFVRAWVPGDFDGVSANDGLRPERRDLARGRQAYERVGCVDCHRFDGAGGNTGPDLTGLGNRFGARDLLESILEPSKEVSSQYAQTELVTVDEELFVGRVEEEDERELWLRTLPPEEELLGFAQEEILERRPHALSRMPAGLLDTLERDEVLDLLAYLLRGAPEEPSGGR